MNWDLSEVVGLSLSSWNEGIRIKFPCIIVLLCQFRPPFPELSRERPMWWALQWEPLSTQRPPFCVYQGSYYLAGAFPRIHHERVPRDQMCKADRNWALNWNSDGITQITILLSWYLVFLQVAASEFFGDLFTYFPSKVFICVQTRRCLCRFSSCREFPWSSWCETVILPCFLMLDTGFSLYILYIQIVLLIWFWEGS